MINSGRFRKIKQGNNNGPTVYWMSREQRVQDNWSLIYAQQLAKEQNQQLLVFFYLQPTTKYNPQHYLWMLQGLEEVSEELKKLNIPFIVSTIDPSISLISLFNQIKAENLVIDMSPLSNANKRLASITNKLKATIYEVDARNTVPVWEVLDKQAYAASSIRARLIPLLPKYYIDYPQVIHSHFTHDFTYPDFISIRKQLKLDEVNINPYYPVSGSKAAIKQLKSFLESKALKYNEDKNNPLLNGTSKLSAYLHFGQLSSLRILIEYKKAFPNTELFNKKTYSQSFLDEVIIRKELAENYCYYNTHYKHLKGGPKWGQDELKKHLNDSREYLYSYEELEHSQTHDALWNTCQLQLVRTGYMPGYLRMYWAKKILEWTNTPKQAMDYAIALNDHYSLDGRDPNGYTGIQWAITGLHDHPWKSRKVFGKIRYMGMQSCSKKFETAEYIKERWPDKRAI